MDPFHLWPTESLPILVIRNVPDFTQSNNKTLRQNVLISTTALVAQIPGPEHLPLPDKDTQRRLNPSYGSCS